MKNFDLFIFDLGRVLIDFDFDIAIAKLNEWALIDRAKVTALFMNSKLAKEWDKGLLDADAFYKIIKQELQLPLEMEKFIPIWNDIFTPKEEMIEFALNLAKERKTYIVSNTNPWHFQYLRKKYVWLQEFEEIIASCDVKMLKPDHEIFRFTLRRAGGIAPERTLYIDDVEENILSAKNLGIHSIHFKSHPLLLEALKLKSF